MKKLISILLVLTMVVLMVPVASIAVFAETETLNNVGNSSQNITATYQAGTQATPTYAVEIIWGSLAFKYTAAGQGTWDPDSLTYTGTSEAEWTCAEGANKVTVTNKSNVAVTATFAATPDTTNGTAVTFAWDDGNTEDDNYNVLELDSAASADENKVTSGVATLAVSGSIAATEQAVTIGTVTVTIE